MAAQLGITREWLSRLETGGAQVQELLQFKITRIENENLVHSHLKSGGIVGRQAGPRSASSDAVASRLPQKREPSTRADCERYFQQLMDTADLSDDANAFPVILHRLKKRFPLDEWTSGNPPVEPERDT